MGFSVFGSDLGGSQPANHFKFRRNLPVVEQTLSYTRVSSKPDAAQSFHRPHHESTPKRLRHEAANGLDPQGSAVAPSFVAEPASTPPLDEDARFLRLAREALVATSTESNLIVDPTIQDLLDRLQYALSPHGNPIRRSESIRANENGQLMIHTFYNGFPNLSNDVFTGSRRGAGEKEWDFLQSESSGSEVGELDSKYSQRKFPCQGCSMSFRRSSDLKRHEKQHLSVPANICSQCGKGFARKDALKRHLGTLTCKRNADKQLYLKNLEYLVE